MQGFSGNIYDGFHESREKDKTQNQYNQKGFPQYTKGKNTQMDIQMIMKSAKIKTNTHVKENSFCQVV